MSSTDPAAVMEAIYGNKNASTRSVNELLFNLTPVDHSDLSDVTEDLDAIARLFRHLVSVRDRRFRFHVYRQCFVASEAIKVMVTNGIAANRKEAVRIGRELQARKLFEHVKQDHYFADRYLFFRFISPDCGGESEQLSSIYPDNDEEATESFKPVDEGGDEEQEGCTTTKSWNYDLTQDLDRFVDRFQEVVELQDRTYNMSTYKSCFVGSEAVDAMVACGMAQGREEAVSLGQALQAARLFEHVTSDHDFKDEYLFYHFSCEQGLEWGEVGL